MPGKRIHFDTKEKKKFFDPYWVSAQRIRKFCPICQKETLFLNEYENNQNMFFFCSKCNKKVGIVFFYSGVIKNYTMHPKLFIERFGVEGKLSSFVSFEEEGEEKKYPVKPMEGYGISFSKLVKKKAS